MKESTKDRVKGKALAAKGKLKENVGRAMGDRKLEREGKVDKTAGRIRKKVGDVEKVLED